MHLAGAFGAGSVSTQSAFGTQEFVADPGADIRSVKGAWKQNISSCRDSRLAQCARRFLDGGMPASAE